MACVLILRIHIAAADTNGVQLIRANSAAEQFLPAGFGIEGPSAVTTLDHGHRGRASSQRPLRGMRARPGHFAVIQSVWEKQAPWHPGPACLRRGPRRSGPMEPRTPTAQATSTTSAVCLQNSIHTSAPIIASSHSKALSPPPSPATSSCPHAGCATAAGRTRRRSVVAVCAPSECTGVS
jgi:hypothetical protein